MLTSIKRRLENERKHAQANRMKTLSFMSHRKSALSFAILLRPPFRAVGTCSRRPMLSGAILGIERYGYRDRLPQWFLRVADGVHLYVVLYSNR